MLKIKKMKTISNYKKGGMKTLLHERNAERRAIVSLINWRVYL